VTVMRMELALKSALRRPRNHGRLAKRAKFCELASSFRIFYIVKRGLT